MQNVTIEFLNNEESETHLVDDSDKLNVVFEREYVYIFDGRDWHYPAVNVKRVVFGDVETAQPVPEELPSHIVFGGCCGTRIKPYTPENESDARAMGYETLDLNVPLIPTERYTVHIGFLDGSQSNFYDIDGDDAWWTESQFFVNQGGQLWQFPFTAIQSILSYQLPF